MALRAAARPVVLLFVVVLGLARCGDDRAAEAPGPSQSTSTSTSAAGRVVEIGFQGGTVTGNTRQQVSRGEAVRLVVTSDVADEVHVHGYDEKAAVPANGTVELSFTADIPGVFEVELEQRGRRLLTLEVRS